MVSRVRACNYRLQIVGVRAGKWQFEKMKSQLFHNTTAAIFVSFGDGAVALFLYRINVIRCSILLQISILSTLFSIRIPLVYVYFVYKSLFRAGQILCPIFHRVSRRISPRKKE